MIRLIKFLITGDWHLHNYEEVEKVHVIDSEGLRIGNKYYMKCSECGDMKVFRG